MTHPHRPTWPQATADERVAADLGDASLAVLPDYLPGPQWRGLALEAQRLRARRAFRPAGIGRGASFRIAPEVRNDQVHWLDPDRLTRRQAAWFARMDALRRVLNRRLYLGLQGFEAHLALYPPGTRYQTHLDRFADVSHRRVSVLLYLNESWRREDGGALRLYLSDADREPWRDVDPAGGTLVAFLSDVVPHEVLPTARERWSLTGWFTAPA